MKILEVEAAWVQNNCGGAFGTLNLFEHNTFNSVFAVIGEKRPEKKHSSIYLSL